MELTASLVESKAEEYRRTEPLYDVEEERIETLPAAFSTGEFNWRDAEWVVRWHYRRFLGEYPHADRQAAEEAFRDTDFEALLAAVQTATSTDVPETQVEALTALDGVDVRVASAFLLFIDPERSLVVGDREWSVLEAAGELADPYPDPPTPADYERYLEVCRELCDRFDCSAWTLYRALWRLAKE